MIIFSPWIENIPVQWVRARTTTRDGVGSQDPSTFLLTSPNYCEHIFHSPQFQFWTKFMHVRMKCFFFMFSSKRRLFPDFRFKINIGYIYQNNWFEVRNSKKWLGRGSPGPLHRPLSRFFSDFILDSFGLRPIQPLYIWRVRQLRLMGGAPLRYFVQGPPGS